LAGVAQLGKGSAMTFERLWFAISHYGDGLEVGHVA
jgi:hypothetical protein